MKFNNKKQLAFQFLFIFIVVYVVFVPIIHISIIHFVVEKYPIWLESLIIRSIEDPDMVPASGGTLASNGARITLKRLGITVKEAQTKILNYYNKHGGSYEHKGNNYDMFCSVINRDQPNIAYVHCSGFDRKPNAACLLSLTLRLKILLKWFC